MTLNQSELVAVVMKVIDEEAQRVGGMVFYPVFRSRIEVLAGKVVQAVVDKIRARYPNL